MTTGRTPKPGIHHPFSLFHPRFLLTLAALFLLAAPVAACSVPVFRYALERWPSDPYEVVVFHRGALTADQQSLVDGLSPEGRAGEIAANVQVRAVDLDQNSDAALTQLWESRASETLPLMVLRYPHPLEPAWAGPLDADNISNLLDSPQRRELAHRLLKGETAVWILLECGDAAKNDAAATLIEQELARAQQTLELPEIDQQDLVDGLMTASPDELKIAFSLVRLPRTDPQEKIFVEMLLGSEPDLREFDEPLAYPIFGRGRALYTLVGAGINAETISEACKTLVGPCTCQVKEQNPGMDVLMAVNWDGLVTPASPAAKPLPPLIGVSDFQAKTDDASPQPPIAEEPQAAGEPKTTNVSAVAVIPAPGLTAREDPAPPSQVGSSAEPAADSLIASPVEVSEVNSLFRNILIVAGLGILAVVVVSLVLFSRNRGSSFP